MQEQLVRQLLSRWAGVPGISQQDRLLVLHTPLGDNVLLAERAEVVEGIGPLESHIGFEADPEQPDYLGCRLRLTMLSERCDIDPTDMLGQPLLLELLTADSRTQLRPFHLVITEFELLGSDNGLARYAALAQPWLACLQWRTDSFVYRDMTVVEIIDAVFSRYQGQGKLAPAWRWQLADRDAYPRRSLCVQHQQTDLEFVCRLLAEEGIFFTVEHQGDPNSALLGQHTIVFRDDNSFDTAAQPVLRMQRHHGASFNEDGLQRWGQANARTTDALSLASPDYRTCDLRPVSDVSSAGESVLRIDDVPGAYAYEGTAQGQRLARSWLEARSMSAQQWNGRATVRSLAPLKRFEVVDAPDGDRGPFVATRLTHQARSNLSADMQAQLQHSVGDLPAWAGMSSEHRGRLSNASDEPLYQLSFSAVRADHPVRAPATARGLNAKPTVHGIQTAVVVGNGPIHTDRDHRVKVQHHWQRGSISSHVLDGPEDNAPASESSGTWVPVAEMLAGGNWGSHFVPRVGQEAVVAYIQGDIERPVVLGAVHNGMGNAKVNGSADGQGNLNYAGQGGATGNAPQWFPGQQSSGNLQGHNHSAVLEGYKSQALASSATGMGGYSQWAHDNTPDGNRIEVSTTNAATRLQLGRLRQQSENQLLQPRGHGLDLSTQAYGALRAGSGLLLSAHGKLASTTTSLQMDATEPAASVKSMRELGAALTGVAQAHEAKHSSEPEPTKLPVFEAQAKLTESITAKAGSGGGTDGGLGEYISWDRPDIVMAAPAGIGWFTPASSTATAGTTISWTAGQHITVNAQGHHAVAVANGIVWFTQGKAEQDGPQETGIKVHSATGSVNVQANTAKAKFAADKKVEITSTTNAVKASSPSQTLLNGGGTSMQINSGGITITTPGPATFKGAIRELTGAGSAGRSLSLPTSKLSGCAQRIAAARTSGAALVER